jgi:hypothetical protein
LSIPNGTHGEKSFDPRSFAPDADGVLCLVALALVDALGDPLDVPDLLIHGPDPHYKPPNWKKIANDSTYAGNHLSSQLGEFNQDRDGRNLNRISIAFRSINPQKTYESTFRTRLN